MKDVVHMAEMVQNSDYNLTQPVVWSNCNDKNSYKYPNFILRYLANPLRRVIPSSAVFPKDQTAVRSDADYSISTTQQSLFDQRFHPCHPLSNDPWIGTDRNQYPLATKRCLPICSQSPHLSKSYQLTALSGAFRIERFNLFSKPPRPIPGPFSDKTRSHLLCDLRSRYQSPDRLWPATGSQSGFQPEEARASLLSAPALFRRKDRRYLGRSLSLRRYSSSSSHHRDSREKPLQAAHGDSRNPCKGRFGLLRPYNCRVSSRSSRFLCHCCQNYPTYSTILWRSPLRGGFSRVLGLGVRIQTLAMENDSTLHCGAPSHSRKAFLATFAFQDGWLYLPCDCYQSFVTTPEPLALLQSESHGRTYHSRTSRSLYSGKNPCQRLGFQSGIFPSGPFRLQLDQLVQTSLFSSRLAATQSSDYSKSVTSGSRPIASSSGTTNFKFTKQLPLRKNIYANFTKYPKQLLVKFNR